MDELRLMWFLNVAQNKIWQSAVGLDLF